MIANIGARRLLTVNNKLTKNIKSHFTCKVIFYLKDFVAAVAAAVAWDEVTNLFWLGIYQLRFQLNQ
jgi:hypothetical protein